ncbi:MAG: CinA family protein [Steroidobacteraceae bacterium]
MTSDAELSGLAAELASALRTRSLQLVTAESCTGGWVGKVLTEIPGSSAWYLGGVVSYSNALKTSLLGVQPDTLAAHGAVSPDTAREMALGAVARCGGTCGLSVTGIAGPDGGTADKPVGLVWFGWAVRQGDQIVARVAQECFAGDRDSVRRQAVVRALRGMIEVVASDG